MRSMIVTHNIGHSVLEGFENRFAPVVLEDRSQVGLGAVLYAGARIGAEAIVASNSYVVGEIPAGVVRDRRSGEGDRQLEPQALRRTPARARAAHDRRPARASRAAWPRCHRRSRTTASRSRERASQFTSSYRGGVDAPAVVLALDVRGDVPDGVAVSTSSAVACTAAEVSSSTRSASSAASAASSSSRGRGAIPGGLV